MTESKSNKKLISVAIWQGSMWRLDSCLLTRSITLDIDDDNDLRFYSEVDLTI